MACGRTTQRLGLRRRLTRCSNTAAALAALILALAAPSVAAPSAPAPVKTTLAITTSDGYARLVFTASEYIDGAARQAGNVLIISFKQPLDVSVNRVAQQAPDYIGAARRDPDGKAVRMALEQNVTIHSMAAGEKFFVDLLPTTWSGVPPGLPQDVVDELARRAREAEKLLERQRNAVQAKKLTPIRVHVANQPTFTRYVFAVPSQTAVSADRIKDKLVLNFNAPVTFDLADAQAALPKTVQEISSELDNGSSLVRFILAANVDTRTFRDESGYVVDVVNAPADANASAAPETAPATQPAQQGAAGEGGTAPSPVPNSAPSGAPSLADAAAKISAAAAKPGPAPARPSIAPPPQPATMAPVAAPPKPTTPPPPAAAATAAPTTPTAPPPATAAATPPPQPPSPPPAKAAVAPASQSPSPPPAQATTAPGLEQRPVVHGALPMPSSADAAKNDAPVPPAPAAVPPQATPAVSNKTSEAAPSHPPAPSEADSAGKIAVELSQQGADLKLSFAFKTPVGMAVFHRADTLWIVFDSKAAIDLSALDGEPSRTVRSYDFSQSGDADIVLLKLDRPRLSSVAADGAEWTLDIGDTVLEPTHALDITRNLIGPNRSSVSIPFDNAQHVHEIADPDVGDKLLRRHRAGAGARLYRRAGFHRIPCARFDPGRGDRTARRRPHRESGSRQSHRHPSLRLDLVDVAADLAAGLGRAADDVQFASLGFRSPGFLFPTPVASHRYRRRGAAASASGAAARTGALLYRARHVSGGQGRARRGAGRRTQCGRERLRFGAARRRRDHDEPARRCAQRSGHARRRRPARRAAVAGACLCAAGPLGQSARSVQDHGGGGGDAAGRAAARRAQGRNALRHRGRRFQRRFRRPQRFSDHRHTAPDGADHRRADGAAGRGHRPQRGRARRLSDGCRFVGSAGRRARHVARSRAALPARRSQARRCHFAARNR